MVRQALVAVTLAATLSLSAFAHGQDAGPYKVLRIQMVGGDGGFDYVTADPDGRNLYVARSLTRAHMAGQSTQIRGTVSRLQTQ